MAPGTSVRSTAFAPIYTASSWQTLVGQTALDAHRKNGEIDALGKKIPRLTNRDAIALVSAWRSASASSSAAFPFWYAYAAPAYGWEENGDALLVDDAQAAKRYPEEYTPSLWLAVHDAAGSLNAARRDNPALAVLDVWSDRDWLADVARALADDNVDVQFKQPLPICRDKKTGELRFPRPKKQPDGTLKDPDCEVVTVDDPITAIVKAIAKLLGRAAKPLAVVGGVYLGLTLLDRRRAKRARRTGKKRRHGNARRARKVLA